jgi:hypothetical protein
VGVGNAWIVAEVLSLLNVWKRSCPVNASNKRNIGKSLQLMVV